MVPRADLWIEGSAFMSYRVFFYCTHLTPNFSTKKKSQPQPFLLTGFRFTGTSAMIGMVFFLVLKLGGPEKLPCITLLYIELNSFGSDWFHRFMCFSCVCESPRNVSLWRKYLCLNVLPDFSTRKSKCGVFLILRSWLKPHKGELWARCLPFDRLTHTKMVKNGWYHCQLSQIKWISHTQRWSEMIQMQIVQAWA